MRTLFHQATLDTDVLSPARAGPAFIRGTLAASCMAWRIAVKTRRPRTVNIFAHREPVDDGTSNLNNLTRRPTSAMTVQIFQVRNAAPNRHLQCNGCIADLKGVIHRFPRLPLAEWLELAISTRISSDT